MFGLLRKLSGKDVPIRVSVDKDICVGCEKCVKMCPEVFQIGGDIVVVMMEDVPPERQKACKEAADHCPVEAITIES